MLSFKLILIAIKVRQRWQGYSPALAFPLFHLPMKDLRRTPRYCLRWPATLLLGEASSGVMVGGRVHDLSLGGASVLSDLHVRDIDQLTLILLPPPLHPEHERKVITVESKLVYSVHSNEHMCFRAGLRFVRFEQSGRHLLEERLGHHSPVFEGV